MILGFDVSFEDWSENAFSVPITLKRTVNVIMLVELWKKESINHWPRRVSSCESNRMLVHFGNIKKEKKIPSRGSYLTAWTTNEQK